MTPGPASHSAGSAPAHPIILTIERHEGASMRSRMFAASARAMIKPWLMNSVNGTLGPRELARAAQIDALAAYGRPARGTRYEPVRLDDCGAEWVHGPGVGKDRSGPVVLYFHGGGWMCCGLNTHRRLVSQISRSAQVPVFSVDYRMIPEVRLDEEVNDCLTAYRWLLDRDYAPEQIVFAGDSAGGHLTFATALEARKHGLPMPAGLVALSPMLDLDLTAKRAHPNARLDPTGALPVLESIIDSLLDGLDPMDPAVSPIRAQLTGLPPTFISAGSTEILCCDAEIMAQRLAEHGVPTILQVWEHQLHVFQMFGPLLPESRASLRAIGRFIRERFTEASAVEAVA